MFQIVCFCVCPCAFLYIFILTFNFWNLTLWLDLISMPILYAIVNSKTYWKFVCECEHIPVILHDIWLINNKITSTLYVRNRLMWKISALALIQNCKNFWPRSANKVFMSMLIKREMPCYSCGPSYDHIVIIIVIIWCVIRCMSTFQFFSSFKCINLFVSRCQCNFSKIAIRFQGVRSFIVASYGLVVQLPHGLRQSNTYIYT